MSNVDPFRGFEPGLPEENNPLDPFSFFEREKPVASAATGNPDEAANVFNLSKKSGVPPLITQANPKTVETDLKAKETALSMENQHVRNYVQADPFAAQISSDDYDRLVDVSKRSDPLTDGRPWHQTFAGSIAQGIRTGIGHTISAVGQLADSEALFESGKKFAEKSATEVPLTEEEKKSVTGHLGMGIGGMLAALPGIAGGGVAGGAIGFGLQSGGAHAVEAEKKGADTAVPFITGFGEGVVLGAIPLHLIQKGGQAVMPGVTGWTLAKLQQAGILGGTMAATNEATAWLDSVIAKNQYDPKAEYTFEGNRLAASFILGGSMGVGFSKVKPYIDRGELPPPGFDPITDNIHIAQTENTAVAIDQLFESVQAAKTRERSPDMMVTFLDQVFKDETVYIPADKVLEIYQTKQNEPIQFGSANDGVFGYIPDLLKQVEEASSRGGDIAVPLKDFLARTDPTIYEAIKDSVRFKTEGMTREEVKELKEETAAKVEEPEKVAGAAIEVDGHVTPGIMHSDALENAQRELGREITEFKDGFITTTGRFVDRLEALKIAEAQEQVEAVFGIKPNQIEGLHVDNLGKTEDIDYVKVHKGMEERNRARAEEAAAERGMEEEAKAPQDLPPAEPGGVESLPDSILSAFPDMRESEGGGLSLNQFTDVERQALRDAGVLQKFETSTGEIYEGVSPEVLWPERQRRQKGGKQKEAEPAAAALAEQIFDQVIVEAEKRSLYLDKAFENGKALGLTEAEFARYSKKIEAADEALAEKAAAAREREVKRPLTQEWKDESTKVEAEVRTDLRSRPDLAADTYLRTGDLPTGQRTPRIYLDRAAVEGQLGEGRLRAITKEDGASPDAVAELLGYKTGQEMVRDLELLNLARETLKETPTAYLNRVVKQEIEARMFEKYGTLEARIADAVRDAALAADRMDVIADEIKAIAKAAGQEPPYSKEFLVGHAEERFGEMPSRQVKYEAFRRDTERAGRQTEKALLKGDFEEAIKWKQRQFLSANYAKLARAFEKDQVKGERLITRLKEKTVKDIGQEYLDQIHGILEGLDERTKRNRDELANGLEGKDFATFINNKISEGWEFAIPEFLLDPTFKRTLNQLTASEYMELQEALTSLVHVGKESQFVLVEGKKVRIDLLKQQMLQNIRARPQRTDFLAQGKSGKMRWKLDAALLKPEMLLEDLDLGNYFGPMSQHIFRPIKEAQLRERVMVHDVAEKLKKIEGDREFVRRLNDQVPNDFFIDPSTNEPYSMTRANMITMALNMGSRSNVNKLINGHLPKEKGQFDGAVLEMKTRRFLNENMRADDWKFVQEMWDIFGELFDPADQMYRDLTGIGLVPVKAEGFSTPHGDMKGGYFPVIYDWKRSNIFVRSKDGTGAYKPDYVRATTPNGYSKTRKEGFSQPITILGGSEELIIRLNQEIHDVATRRAVIDTGRFIYDPEIQAAIRDHYGPEYQGLLPRFLEDFANAQNVDRGAKGAFDTLINKARKNVVIQALGYNWNVIASPATGKLFYNPSYMKTAVTMFRTVDGSQSYRDMAWEKSPELRQTMANLDRDLREQVDVLKTRGKWDQFQLWAATQSMRPTAYMELNMRTITFLTEYQQNLAKGLAEPDAVYGAEREVRRMHGATSKADLSQVFRDDNAYVKSITMFQSYLNTIYNWQRQSKQLVENGEYAQAMQVVVGAFLVPSIFTGLLFAEKGKNESIGAYMARVLTLQAASTVLLANQAAQMILEGNRPRDPWTTIVSTVWDSFKNSYEYANGRRTSDQWLKTTINTPGVLLGLPTGQIAKTSQFLHDVRKRKQNPRGFGEWMHGLRTGRAREK